MDAADAMAEVASEGPGPRGPTLNTEVTMDPSQSLVQEGHLSSSLSLKLVLPTKGLVLIVKANPCVLLAGLL